MPALTPSLLVCPWAQPQEWVKVAQNLRLNPAAGSGLSVSGLRKAEAQIRMWKMRKDRITAGSDTCLYLLRALLLLHRSRTGDSASSLLLPLALSTALNRFLNLVAQIGEKRLGLTNYFDVAEKFNIPDWVVGLRHETTHGQMPSADLLETGVEFAFQWLRTYYWGAEADRMDRQSKGKKTNPARVSPLYTRLQGLLECHAYLKIYSVWGTTNAVQLAGEHREVYDHVVDLWNKTMSYRKRSRALTNLKDGLEVLRNELKNILNTWRVEDTRRGTEGDRTSIFKKNAKVLAQVLVNEELLLPAEEFLESLKEDSDQDSENSDSFDADSVQLPGNLLRMWTNLLSMTSNCKVMPEIVRALVEKCETSRKLKEVALARAWVVKICSECQGDFITLEKGTKRRQSGAKAKKEAAATPSKRPRFNNTLLSKEQVASSASEFNSLVSDLLLETPSESRLQLLPSFLRLRTPTVTGKQEKQLSHLMEASMGNITSGKDEYEDQIFTLTDLTQEAEDEEEDMEQEDEENESVETSWALCPNQEELRNTHLGAGLCLPASEEDPEEDDGDFVDVSVHADFYPAMTDPEAFLKLWNRDVESDNEEDEEDGFVSSQSDAAAFSAAENEGEEEKKEEEKKKQSLPAFYRTEVNEEMTESRGGRRGGGSARKRRKRN